MHNKKGWNESPAPCLLSLKNSENNDVDGSNALQCSHSRSHVRTKHRVEFIRCDYLRGCVKRNPLAGRYIPHRNIALRQSRKIKVLGHATSPLTYAARGGMAPTCNVLHMGCTSHCAILGCPPRSLVSVHIMHANCRSSLLTTSTLYSPQTTSLALALLQQSKEAQCQSRLWMAPAG